MDTPDDPVGQLLDRSRRLGSDLRVTNHGGGNTSVKVDATDPVTGVAVRRLWIKGSGGDLATLRRPGLAVLDLGRVRALGRRFTGPDSEAGLFELLADCLVEPRGAAPSIDTPIHALLPWAHVDHVHPDAVLALATAEAGERLVGEAFEGRVGWLDWRRPGFDIALRLLDLVDRRPGLRGVVLGGHGLVTWGDTSEACCRTTLALVEQAARHLDARAAVTSARVLPLEGPERRRQAARVLPLLRGLAGGGERHLVGHFADPPALLSFTLGQDFERLVEAGTSCPDHFLRIKQRPLVIAFGPEADLLASRASIEADFRRYRERYAAYYEAHRTAGSPAMRSPDPAVVLWPGVGMFTFARSKPDARVAAEFYLSAVNAMRGAETVDRYRGLPEDEVFGVEYWALEEAKLRRRPPEPALQGRVALVTGAGGGIGSAVARRLAAEGAAVVLADLEAAGLEELASELGEQGLAVQLDVSREDGVRAAFEAAALAFGGLDIVVNSAGVSSSQPLVEAGLDEYERLHRVISTGSFLISRELGRLAEVQRLPADVVYVVSKNAVVAGPDNVAYATAKAAQLHQLRLVAAELASLGVRVNGVNPDGVVRGSRIFAGEWGLRRAAAHGVERERLGEFYAQRTLLKKEVLPEDVAAACLVLVRGELAKTTGHVIPVDGGVTAAFLR